MSERRLHGFTRYVMRSSSDSKDQGLFWMMTPICAIKSMSQYMMGWKM